MEDRNGVYFSNITLKSVFDEHKISVRKYFLGPEKP